MTDEIKTDTGESDEEANRRTREEGYHERYTVTVLVAGALEDEQTFYGYDEAHHYADSQSKDLAETSAEEWQVYVLADTIEFSTDHRPYKSGPGQVAERSN